jgi:hypothetical protein
MHRFPRRLSYANVLASLSLFLALGGGAYAAGTQTNPKTGPRITPIAIATDDAGTLVARAGNVRLEMAGVGNALRVRNATSAGARYACHGIDGDWALTPILMGRGLIPGETNAIVANADDPQLLTCRLADGETGAVTEVFIGPGADAIYAGHAISDGTQQ